MITFHSTRKLSTDALALLIDINDLGVIWSDDKISVEKHIDIINLLSAAHIPFIQH